MSGQTQNTEETDPFTEDPFTDCDITVITQQNINGLLLTIKNTISNTASRFTFWRKAEEFGERRQGSQTKKKINK